MEAEQQLRAILDATMNGFAITERGVVLEVNDRFAALLEYTPDEIVGMSLHDLCSPEDAGRALQNAYTGEETPAEQTFVFKRKDGSLLVTEGWAKAVL